MNLEAVYESAITMYQIEIRVTSESICGEKAKGIQRATLPRCIDSPFTVSYSLKPAILRQNIQKAGQLYRHAD
jgi:hypothetical protein